MPGDVVSADHRTRHSANNSVTSQRQMPLRSRSPVGRRRNDRSRSPHRQRRSPARRRSRRSISPARRPRRSRSRSDSRERRRSASRERRHRRDARRSPSRSYSRERRRSDSRERNDRRDGKAPADGKPAPTKPTVAITDDMAPEEMMAALGLPTQLSSTKGKNVEDDAANMSGARVMSKRKYRQYMNRLGGFNRPLGKQF